MATRPLKISTFDAARHVLFVDKKVIVISKPAGVVSQLGKLKPGDNETITLDHIFDELTRSLGLDVRPKPVHRLDKGTTGALLFARTKEASHNLARKFRTNTINKTYLALVRGGRKTFKTDKGEIDAKLFKSEDGRVSVSPREAQTQKGVETRTSWELIASSEIAPLSLLRLTLHTGFKHQLRVHLASELGAPILGDDLHSHSKSAESIMNHGLIPERRMFLHASHLSFYRYHEMAAGRYTVGVTAPLPKEFAQLCTRFGLTPDPHEIQGGVTINGEPIQHNKTFASF